MKRKEYRILLKNELQYYDQSLFGWIIDSESYNIGRYIKAMRNIEYCRQRRSNLYYAIKGLYNRYLYNKLSYKLGYQIKPGTCGWGLIIYHLGPIIVNAYAKIGNNCKIYPGVCIGQKEKGDAPVIGDNCFIGLGAKVFGKIKIGSNVTIAPNSVVTKDIPDNCIVGGVPAKIIKYKETAL